ncbi:BspA family leucine-rich repeat surface protein [Listeria innocua]|uniref:BspA family leucine-rich repeat surface protein n=2 Tax=Listeria innocua TaxID=1642 RepID=UPI00162ABA10|nr:BspA family leucine-rich repeat surface protein [Listeria innocua]MBC1908170.1 BspA family leucine-rich repeat surface protein [Listeria innocua]MBC1929024.1 BspA family leucine-rich repeat surface protein [Listeria innocua]
MEIRKKSLRQLVVAFLLLNMVVLPIQNSVLANELSTTEEVVTEETKINESATAETNINNSENMESEAVLDSEETEAALEKSKVLTDAPKVKSSEKQEASEKTSSSTQQKEGSPSTKFLGTFPNGSTATWERSGSTLTISGGTLVDPGMSIWGLTGISYRDITKIVLEDKVIVSGSCSSLFQYSRGTSLDLSNLDTSNVTDMSYMFDKSDSTSLDLSSFDTSSVTNMAFMFYSSAAASIDVSNFDTSSVTNMYCMFRYCDVATSIDVSNFNTSNVTNMGSMFSYTSAVTGLDVSEFDTSKVTNMNGMFQSSAATSIDVSGFNTSNVTDMNAMFRDSTVTSIDVSNFNTSNVMDMRYMFFNSAVTSLDVSNFDTSKVTYVYLYDMFSGARQLQSITLGSQFQFKSIYVRLTDPPTTADYTGKWQNVGTGTVDKPKGSFIGTATELMSNYTGSTMADTYVWQPMLIEVNVQDSILMVGDTWNPEDNFLSALDNAENPVDFKDITVTGSVDTTQPGLYTVTYSYGGIASTATITVLETIPASWINFFVDGTNVRSIPGSALSTPEWDLTTGLWDKWNPGTVKVPTDKLPSEPTKQGYEFKGWEDTAGTIVDFNTLDLDLNSQNEFDFYAAFEKKEYTVTFDVEGNQEQEAVLFDELITEPTVPNKAGYAFTGWYDAPTGGNKWDFSTDTMPAKEVTLYARFNKLGFVTPEIKPSIPTIITPITPGIDPLTPSVKPPTIPGSGGNQAPSSDSGLNTVNTGNTMITSQEDIVTSSPATSQESKLAKLGENNSLLLQGFGLLMVLSGLIFFWKKRKNGHS